MLFLFLFLFLALLPFFLASLGASNLERRQKVTHARQRGLNEVAARESGVGAHGSGNANDIAALKYLDGGEERASRRPEGSSPRCSARIVEYHPTIPHPQPLFRLLSKYLAKSIAKPVTRVKKLRKGF